MTVSQHYNISQPPEASPATAAHDPGRPAGLAPWLVLLSLGAAVWLVYGWFADAPFIFDDIQCIANNISIMQLSPLWGDAPGSGPLWPPNDFTTAGRPLVNLTLALNVAAGGLDPAGFHHVNMAIHVVSAVMVWAIVRRTLALPYFNSVFADVSGSLAYAVALVWALHPVQTETLEYVSQRTELMVGFFYLATMLASLRYFAAGSWLARGCWLIIATLSCLAGMACKEVMVTAPVAVLLYDRTFVAGSFRAALRRSWPLYVGLAATWGLLFTLNASGPRSASAGFHLDVPAYQWWMTQVKVLFIYLKLAVWPWPLVIHYDVPYLSTMATAWPWLLAALILVAAALYFWWRQAAIGFVVAWVLLVLSPTLVVPIVSEVAAERRMYLPLAAITAFVMAGSYKLVRRSAARLMPRGSGLRVTHVAATATVVAALAVATGFGLLSARRLSAYRDALTLWQDAVLNQPQDHVAHINLGVEYLNRRQLAAAIEQFETALACSNDHLVKTHLELGTALAVAERHAEAIKHFQEALALKPETDFFDAPKLHHFLAISLTNVGREEEAISHFDTAMRLGRDTADVRRQRALALAAAGREQDAFKAFEEAIRAGFDSAELYNDYGRALLQSGLTKEAILELEHALRRRPAAAPIHYSLGVARASLGDNAQALEHFELALRFQPDYDRVHPELGQLLLRMDRPKEAIDHLQQVAKAAPDSAEAHYYLATALAGVGRWSDAIHEFDNALRLKPGYTDARSGLDRALESAGRRRDK